MTDHLLTETDGHGIAWLTFNRPEARNATSVEMIEALHATLARIETDEAVRCVVLRGAGDHFMSGGDVKAFAALADEPPEQRGRAMRERLAKSEPIFNLLERLPQPVVACVRGAVAGGGLGFLLSSDLAIAATDAKFVLSHVKLGLVPDGSSTWHLPRAVGMKRARQMALLAEPVDAATALDWGLVNWLLPPGEVAAETERIARKLAATPRAALAHTRRLLNASATQTLAQQVVMEGDAIALCAQTDDFVAGLRAFAARPRK